MKWTSVEMRDSNSTEPGSAMDLLHEGLKQSTVHVNVGQKMIVMTEDKMRLGLDALIGTAKNRQNWHAPAGMLTTAIAAIGSAKFHDATGLSGDQWRTLFYVIMFLTLIWLVTAFAKGKPRFTVDSFVESLKNQAHRPKIGPMEVLPVDHQRLEATHFAMNVSLSRELEKFVRGSVSTGRYTSASEVVREALRLLQETDRTNKTQEALAQSGCASFNSKLLSRRCPASLSSPNEAERRASPSRSDVEPLNLVTGSPTKPRDRAVAISLPGELRSPQLSRVYW
jgi:putative addiction module CopG family antidote